MIKVFLLLKIAEFREKIINLLDKNTYETTYSNGNVDDIITQINYDCPDIILIDSNYDDCEFIIRQFKSLAKNQNIQIIMLLDDDKTDLINLSDGIIQKPYKDEIILSTINSHYKIKKSLDRLFDNNKELSRSLYQLNVLYNTSSQFTGTLNTKKLYDIMIEAMEKTLSFDVSCVLTYNSLTNPILNLNTLYPPSESLVDALKIRSILNYKSIFDNPLVLNEREIKEIEIFQKTKQMRSNKIFGLETISFDTLFAPIKVGDDFFGIVELFRQTPFSSEDVTCFQAIAHQVALPLRSAKLYEEISITNKKLEKLEKLKSEFISIVSHELRTPLTPINNSLEIVLSGQAGELTPEINNFISMAKRNIQRLSGIIEDLLDLSRIQTGKLDYRYKICDITPSLELLKNTFLQVAQEKNIKINLIIKEKLPEIYADSRRIEQILSNLVSNSLKFTSQGGMIEVEASVIDENQVEYDNLIMPKIKPNGKYIKISVKDNGIGMKKEDIPKIFDKFSQIETSLNRNKGGVGLGLTITKQLIDAHLGAVWVESQEQKGSTFSVILPLLDKFKIFQMDLSHVLTNNDDTGIIKISYNSDLNLIEELKANKILNLTRLSKELIIENSNKTDYYVFIAKISSGSFEAITKTISDYCLNKDKNKHDIILKSIYNYDKNTDAFCMIENLNN